MNVSESGRWTTFARGTKLKWTFRCGRSVRAYDIEKGRSGWFCVSTGSGELVFVLDGCLILELGPYRQQYVMNPGQSCIILPRTPHIVHAERSTKMVVVDLQGIYQGDMGIIGVPGEKITRGEDRILLRLWEQNQDTPEEKLLCMEEEALRLLDSDNAFLLESSHNTQLMLDVKKHLEDNYDSPLVMADIARRFGLDRFYMLRNFKKNFGIPPLQYLHFIRLERFLLSLIVCGRSETITSIAAGTGFGDYATFSRKFRRFFGKSPSFLVSDRRSCQHV